MKIEELKHQLFNLTVTQEATILTLVNSLLSPTAESLLTISLLTITLTLIIVIIIIRYCMRINKQITTCVKNMTACE